MAEALQQLRRAIIAGDPIAVDEKAIIINDTVRLERTAGTKLRSLVGRGPKEYTLEEVYFQYKFRDLPYNVYLSECAKEGVQHVVAIDRSQLVDYLKGDKDSLAGIVPNEPSNIDTSVTTRKGAKLEQNVTNNGSAISADGHENISSSQKKDDLTFAANRMRIRDQRSIDSVLMVKDWDFSGLREKLAQHVNAAKKGRLPNNPSRSSGGNIPGGTELSNHSRKSQHQPGPAAKSFDPRGDRYTNNEDRFWRENMGSDFQEFGIDMSGSFKAKPSTSQPQSRAQNQSKLPDTRSMQQGRNVNQHHHRSGSKTIPDRTAKDGSAAKRPKLINSTAAPIIIIPAGASSLVCAANAVEFFQNGHLMTKDEMRAKEIPLSQPARLTMLRKPGGNCSQAKYHVVSNPNKLSREEWDNVVAVVLSGHTWQFKQWPIFKNDVNEFFKTVQGFYFHYDDVKPSGDLNKWTIRKLNFPRDRRHNDGQVQAQFWNFVDSFITRKRIPVRY